MFVEISTGSEMFLTLVAVQAGKLAASDSRGEFYLSEAIRRVALWDTVPSNHIYGPGGISERLQNLGVIEHAPVKGHFRFVKGYEFPNWLV